MLKLTALALVASLALVPSVAHADKDFAEGRGATYDCGEDGTVNILHSGGTYVLTGECRQVNIEGSNVRITIADVDQLAVNGSGNVIKLRAVDTILVNGSRNNVSWRTAKGGDRPTVAAYGDNNSIARSN